MNSEKIRDLLVQRAKLHPNDYCGIEACWKELTKLCTEDMSATIRFLDICTETEFSYLSEVFEDIAECLPSKAFISTLYQTAEKYPEETGKYNVMNFIRSAECIVETELGK